MTTQKSQRLTLFYQVKDQYPFIAKYKTAWPVKSLTCQYMTNHRQYRRRAKVNGTEQDHPEGEDPDMTMPSAPNPVNANDSSGGGQDDEDLSDSPLSD